MPIFATTAGYLEWDSTLEQVFFFNCLAGTLLAFWVTLIPNMPELTIGFGVSCFYSNVAVLELVACLVRSGCCCSSQNCVWLTWDEQGVHPHLCWIVMLEWHGESWVWFSCLLLVVVWLWKAYCWHKLWEEGSAWQTEQIGIGMQRINNGAWLILQLYAPWVHIGTWYILKQAKNVQRLCTDLKTSWLWP